MMNMFAKTARSTGLAAITALSLATVPVLASDVNDIIGGSGTATTAKTVAPKVVPTPSTTEGGTGAQLDKQEAWVKHADAINHVQLLAGRPLPNDTCRNVIFDARPSLKKRHSLVSGKNINLNMKDLCLVGFRNDSEKRTLVVRLGEAFETLAIVLDPKLFTGYAIAPGQQITVPLRQLPVPSLNVSVEVIWEDDLEKPTPRINQATLSLKRES